jgi:hypothetical protein
MDFDYREKVDVVFPSVDSMKNAVFGKPDQGATELMRLSEKHAFGLALNGRKLSLLPIEGQKIQEEVAARVREIATQNS